MAWIIVVGSLRLVAPHPAAFLGVFVVPIGIPSSCAQVQLFQVAI